jgi:hypothetical protein
MPKEKKIKPPRDDDLKEMQKVICSFRKKPTKDCKKMGREECENVMKENERKLRYTRLDDYNPYYLLDNGWNVPLQLTQEIKNQKTNCEEKLHQLKFNYKALRERITEESCKECGAFKTFMEEIRKKRSNPQTNNKKVDYCRLIVEFLWDKDITNLAENFLDEQGFEISDDPTDGEWSAIIRNKFIPRLLKKYSIMEQRKKKEEEEFRPLSASDDAPALPAPAPPALDPAPPSDAIPVDDINCKNDLVLIKKAINLVRPKKEQTKKQNGGKSKRRKRKCYTIRR